MKLVTKLYLTLGLLFGLIATLLWLVEAIDRRYEGELAARHTAQAQETELTHSLNEALRGLERLLHEPGGSQSSPGQDEEPVFRRALRNAADRLAAGETRLAPLAGPFLVAQGKFQEHWDQHAALSPAAAAKFREQHLLPHLHLALRPAVGALERASGLIAETDTRALADLRATHRLRERVGLGLIFLTAFVAVGYWHHILIRPLRRMEADAREVTAGRRTVIRHFYHGADELGALSEAFNTLLDTIRTNSFTRTELERLVAQRTAELQTSAQRLDLALEASGTSSWESRLETDETVLDTRWAVLLGEAPRLTCTTARRLLALVHPDDKGLVLRALDQCKLHGADDYTIEHRVRHGAGHWLWILSRGRVVERAASGQARRMIGTNTDISGRREAEQALRRSQARLEFLLNRSPSIVYTCKASGDFGATFVSENIRAALGYAPEEFTGESGFWAQHIHADDLPRVFGELPRIFQQDSHAHEYRFLHRDGSWRWIRDELRLIRTPSGEPLEIVGSMLDITGQKHAEAAARAQQEQTLLFQSTLLALRDHETEEPPAFFRVATEGVARALRVGRAGVWLFDDTRSAIVCADLFETASGAHTSGARLAAQDYPAYFAAASRLEPITADDAAAHEATREFAAGYLAPLGIASLLDVPIRVGGRLAGLLCCEHIGPVRHWTAEEAKFAVSAASYLMLSLEQSERRRAEAALAQQAEFFAALNQTSVDLLNRREKRDILQAIVERSSTLIGAPHAELALVEGDELVVRACTGATDLAPGRRFSRSQAVLFWRALDRREPLVLADFATHPEARPAAGGAIFHAAALLPIVHGERCLGLLILLRTETDRPFGNTEIAEACLFTQFAALVLHQAGIYEDAVRVADERTVELRRREAMYRNLVESIAEGYYVADARSAFTYCSPTLEAMGGFSPGELLGRSSFRLIADEDRARVVESYRAWLADPAVQDVRCEFQVVTKTGRKFWVEQSTHFERDAAGRATEGRNIVRDISERKAAEEELRASEHRYQRVVANIIDGLMIDDTDGRVVFANDRFLELFGLARSDLPGLVLEHYVAPEHRAALRERHNRRMGGEDVPNHFEYEGLRKDGTRRWFEVRVSPVVEKGVRIGSQSAIRDITERKLAETALRESEERFRGLFDNSPVIVGLLSLPEGRVVEINQAAEKAFGISLAEARGKTSSELGIWADPADRARYLQLLQQQGTVEGFETRMRRRDGTLFTVLYSGTLVTIAGRQYTLSTLLDITDRRHAEAELRASEERFQLVNRAVFNVIWDQDVSTNATWWSEQFTTVYGHDRAAASADGDFWRAHLHPEDRDRVVARVNATLAGGGDLWADEYRFRRADGSYAHVQDRAHIVRDAAGRPLRLIGAMQDVTEREGAMRAVRASEMRFRGVFDRSPIPIVLADLPDGRIIDANTAAERTFGYSRSELSDITTRDLGVWTDSETRNRFIALMREMKSVTGFEVRLRRRDGAELDFLFSGTLLEVEGREYTITSLLDITGRKAAEKALRDSEERYRALVESSTDAIFLLDTAGRIHSANQAAVDMHGYTLDELRTMRIAELDAPGEAGPTPEQNARILAGETLLFEIEHRHKNGSTFPLEVSATAVRIGDNTFVLATERDITDRRKAEAESQRLAILARETNMAVIITGTTGLVEWVNAGFTTLTGYTLDEVRGRKPGAILQGPATDPETQRLLSENIRACESVGVEILNYTKTGDRYWTHLTLQPMRDPAGRHIGFFATSFDITDRRLTSEALKFLSVQAAALAGPAYFDEVARFLATLLDVDHGFICDYVPGDRGHFHSHGHSRRETPATGQAGEVRTVDQKACSRLAEVPFFHVEEGAAALFPSDTLLHERGISGYAAVEIRGGQGNVLGFLGVMHRGALRHPQRIEALLRLFAVRVAGEMTRHQTEQQLRQAQKLESLGTLAGGIAHDFNNILTGILGFVELTRFELPPEHGARPWVDGIGASGLRAKDLVRQILTFSRKGEGERAPVQLFSVVREAIDLLRSSLPAMVRLEDDIARDCPPVLANATQIHQVIMNLCTNAWHALPPENGLIRVTLAPHTLGAEQAAAFPELNPGAYVRLTVEDNGCGMPPEVAERVFEPFFTTKEAGKGTGLGLAVVHGVVSSHGGAIALRTTPGAGTVFELFFPALTATTTRAAAPVNGRPAGGRERILFVDDDAHARTPLALLLSRLGYQVEEVDNPVEASRRFNLRPEAYDLVITDFAMPALSGATLTRQLRARRPDIPVILISGFLDAERKQALDECGASLILRKPIDLHELADAVRRTLTPPTRRNGRD